MCQGPVEGFRVMVHSPQDYPRLLQQFIHLSSDNSMRLAIQPVMIKASDSVRGYQFQRYSIILSFFLIMGSKSKIKSSIFRRQCYFSDERPLQYFKRYSQSNCELECFANATLKTCGCVHFSMPSKFRNLVVQFHDSRIDYNSRTTHYPHSLDSKK